MYLLVKKNRIARRLQFKKITKMLMGQTPKLNGAIYNVSVDVFNTCNTLRRPAESNGLSLATIKRKLEYRGHIYFDSVRPSFIFMLLQCFKLNNPIVL